MNQGQIHIPPDLPEEARALVEEVNWLLRIVTVEIAEMNADPETYSPEQRRDVATRCEYALGRFKEMREDLRRHGLEWSEWPEYVGD